MAVRFRRASVIYAQLYAVCPNLARARWRVASPYDDAYQCIAWAAGRMDRQMWPTRNYWWFSDLPLVEIPQEASIDHFVQGFASLGYKPCQKRTFEFGYQKVAIFVNDVGVTHMARQHILGRGWLSKVGDWEDIVHAKLEDVEGDMSPLAYQYGRAVQLMKRSWGAAIANLDLFRCAWNATKCLVYRLLHPRWCRVSGDI